MLDPFSMVSNALIHAPRLYVPADFLQGQGVVLPDAQAHYLKNVLRLSEDDFVRVFNPEAGEWLSKVTFPAKRAVAVLPQEVLRLPEPVVRAVHLFFSPIKKDRMDILVEKAVELGVTHLHPVLFQRSIVREVKPERLMAQIVEAAEQCERLYIPALLPLLDVKKVMAGFDGQGVLYAALERQDVPLLRGEKVDGACGFLVGPEGGITPDETEFLCAQKFVKPVSLGPRILRAETAVFYGLSHLAL